VLQPKRVKYRKVHSGHLRGEATSGNTVVFGDFGLMAEESAWLTARQIEAARRVLVRYVRRGGKLWLRIFPDKVATKKPAETRMGKGKGATEGWVAVVKPGRILYEMEGVGESEAAEAFRLAGHKLPFPTRFVSRRTLL